MDWKKAGNGHYAAGRYADAVEAYTRGLEDRPGAPPPLSSRGTIGRRGTRECRSRHPVSRTISF